MSLTDDQLPENLLLPFARSAFGPWSRSDAGLQPLAGAGDGPVGETADSDDPAQLKLWLRAFIQQLPTAASVGGR